MQTEIAPLPGYKINEYLIALNPHEELREKILQVKEDFAVKYKTDAARWTKPQLTLVSFVQYEMIEERIVNRLRNIGMGQFPFKVELKDFGSFPAHTVFINVTTKLPVQALVKEIRADVQRLLKFNEEHKPHFILEPHLTIGRKLKPWQYEKSWLEYSNRHFTGRFIADSMVLLKREMGESKYRTVNKFDFQNLPVATRQGTLFG